MLRERIRNRSEAADSLQLLDAAITTHGFVPYMRDYRLLVSRWSDGEQGVPYAYVFTHCVFAEATTMLPPHVWADSWDTPTDLADWQASEEADGFAWGAAWATVEGAAEVPDSHAAKQWSDRLGRSMREAVIQTNVFELRLVFSELRVEANPPDATE